MMPAGTHDSAPKPSRVLWAGLLLGLGLGGFVDGIVLHQILQWHHLLSSTVRYPVDTLAGLEVNTLWDGLFHAVTFLATVTGIVFLWVSARQTHTPWSTKLLIGLLLMGWGSFNLVEGVINHHLLGLHHVNETVPMAQRGWWDLAFLIWGLGMLGGGYALARAGERGSSRALSQRPPGEATDPNGSREGSERIDAGGIGVG